MITSDYVIPIIIIITIAGIYVTLFQTKLFKIKNVNCTNSQSPCTNEQVLAEINRQKGKNIITFNEEDLEQKLQSGNRTIKSVEVNRVLPNTLSVKVAPTKEEVALQVKSESNKWIIIDDNYLITRISTTDPNLPTIFTTSTQEIQVGNEIPNDNLNKAVSLTRKINEQFMSVEAIEVNNIDITLKLENGITALVTTTKDLDEQLLTLQAILAQDTITDGDYSIIDVRFDQPVLKSRLR